MNQINNIYNKILEATELKSLSDKKFLLAVSGGIDSIFLYHSFLRLSKEYNFKISLAHVNYNTSINSKLAMFLCQNLSQKNKHPLYLKICNLNSKENFESWARNIRYKFFNNIKRIEKYDYIVTAHNKDDLIETLYMQKNNKKDISIIPLNQIHNKIIRPLININNNEIKIAINQSGHKFIEDLTNKDLKYKRNNLRLKILPKIKNKDKIIADLLDIYKIKIKNYNDFKIKSINKNKDYIKFNKYSDKLIINRQFFSDLDVYEMKLILQGAVEKYFKNNIEKTEKYWINLFKKMSSNKNNYLERISDNLKLHFNKKYIFISRNKNFIQAKLLKDGTTWVGGNFSVERYNSKEYFKNNKNIFLYPKSFFNKGLTIRKWFYGDKYMMLNGHSKKISKLFIDNKIDLSSKECLPIILKKDKIEWIPGLAFSKNDYKNLNNLLKIQWHGYE